MFKGFSGRRPSQSELRGTLPIDNGSLRETGFAEMPCHKLRRVCRGFRELLLDRFGNAGMQLSPLIAQQRAVRGILHQGMLENEIRLQRLAALKQKRGVD